MNSLVFLCYFVEPLLLSTFSPNSATDVLIILADVPVSASATKALELPFFATVTINLALRISN